MKKILWVGEASYLNSGYSNYSRELLLRLHNSGKYEVAELAGYGTMSDGRVKKIPWKYYAGAPEEYDSAESKQLYKSKQTHEFGEWRFDKVLLDFRPDVVCGIRDYWMDSFIRNSHLRPFYSWLEMPTADSEPQEEDWVDCYMNCDGVLTYTDWSKGVLDRNSGGRIKTIASAPYGVDYDIFSPPTDKAKHKESYGLQGDSIIIGTVMRNQKRKLFPDLIHAFANALDKLPAEVANRTYLYFHTSYPDRQCWDLPRLVREAGIGTHTLVSYICKMCKRTHCSIFQDARTICPHCNNLSCIMPNVGVGHNTEQLVDVYRLFDLYVQYSISEGFGIPQVEAAACGVPIAATDATAMSDIVRRLDGRPIKVERWFREFESHAYRAYPDNSDLTKYLVSFCQTSGDYRKRKGEKARKLSKEYYNWERTAGVWEYAIDSLPKAKKNWNDPPELHQPNDKIPENLTNAEFVQYVLNAVYYMPEQAYGLIGTNLLRDLNFGATITSKGVEPLDKKKIVERLKGKTQGRNLAEQARCGLIKLTEEKFIKFANERNKINS
jgi:glycosyltransferase involved in cell wall biosynthesis